MKLHFFIILLFLFPLSSVGQSGGDINNSCFHVVNPLSLLTNDEFRGFQKFAKNVSVRLQEEQYSGGEPIYRGIVEDGVLHIHVTYKNGVNFVVLIDIESKVIFAYSSPNGTKNGITRTEVKPVLL